MDPYTLNQLRYFYKLAQKLNYRVAAEELLISEPALSKQINTLESLLDVKLFQKVGRNIQLTEKGKAIAFEVGRVLREIDLLNQKVNIINNPKNASMRIGISGNQIIYPYIEELRKQFANLNVYVSEMDTQSVIRKLKRDELDIGMVYDTFSDDELITHVTFEDEVMLVVSTDNQKFADLTEATIDDLKEQKTAVLTDSYFIRKIIDDYFANHLIIPDYQFELNNYQSCLNVLKGNDAVTFVTSSYIQSADMTGFKALRIADMHAPLKMSLMTLKEKSLSEPLRQLIDLFNKKRP